MKCLCKVETLDGDFSSSFNLIVLCFDDAELLSLLDVPPPPSRFMLDFVLKRLILVLLFVNLGSF